MKSVLVKANALANTNRLQMLELLKTPELHFAPGDFDQNAGVCGLYISEKLGIAPPTASAHLKVLVQAGFLTSLRIGKFTYFKRIPSAMEEFAEDIRSA
ncbi:ArsR/SmtB family transcription factor [Janthinobacterium agaricidamnosum]|uniref:ArsR family transcriptional regulator n=1 Tax=Janthinobacterium agaricidamnosum NBRC 102515 = DSM 9628 TaxID=1349767 RepID=W0V1X2_9BURK|nr:ArsR family transcriptional regulator [Janthinobacterium agaricidamnosum]CDG82824.1 arsR family transcriptional regulator [Janthinobacterium agaricidamnosum NBRC 102515 = DSM 9628]